MCHTSTDSIDIHYCSYMLCLLMKTCIVLSELMVMFFQYIISVKKKHNFLRGMIIAMVYLIPQHNEGLP
jgi:hypothetical protein